MRAFARFVVEGIDQESPWKDLKGQIYLGSERFVEAMQQHIRQDQLLRDILLRQCRRIARVLADYAEQFSDQDRAMAEAY